MANHVASSHGNMGCNNEIEECGRRFEREFLHGNAKSPLTVSGSVEMLGLRQRTRQPTRFAAISEDDPDDFLLSQRSESKSPTQSEKVHSFTGCIELFLSTCRSNVKMLLRSTCKRRSKIEYQKMPRASPEPHAQVGSLQLRDTTLSCLGRARRWDVRRIFGDIIKIEEDIVYSVPRSVLYYG